jgi:hypothetical protein
MKRAGTTVFGLAIAYVLFSFLVDSIVPRGATRMRIYNVIDVVFLTAFAIFLLVQRRSIVEQGIITYERSRNGSAATIAFGLV